MIHVQFPPTAAERPGAPVRSTDDPKLRPRLRIALMAHRGRPGQDIAADRGANRKTVTRGVIAYRDGGLDALRPREAKGTPGHAPKASADEVKRWVTEGPAERGPDRANGTHEELADHLPKTHGTRTSRRAAPRFCAGTGVRRYRPTCRHDRGDPVQRAQAQEGPADPGKGRRPVNASG